MIKFTDEELSRILGEADCGHLVQFGLPGWTYSNESTVECCINQAAYNECDVVLACNGNHAAAHWFDRAGHSISHDVDTLLVQLVRNDLA